MVGVRFPSARSLLLNWRWQEERSSCSLYGRKPAPREILEQQEGEEINTCPGLLVQEGELDEAFQVYPQKVALMEKQFLSIWPVLYKDGAVGYDLLLATDNEHRASIPFSLELEFEEETLTVTKIKERIMSALQGYIKATVKKPRSLSTGTWCNGPADGTGKETHKN